MSKLNKITIILPMWNQSKYTDRMIAQLNEQSLNEFSLIVVDDGSNIPYSMPSFIKGDYELVHHPKNLGVSNAWNTGTLAAFNLFQNPDCICVINNDIEISKNLLEELLYYHQNTEYDIICPQIKNNTNTDLKLISDLKTEYYIHGHHGFCFSINSRVLYHRYYYNQYFFDTAFSGADHEDLDFQLWCHVNGYKGIIIKRASIWDNKSASSVNQIKPNKNYILNKWGGESRINMLRSQMLKG